ncbi:MAG: cytochrome c oxidase assembly protein [Alphaproteobacteria bacterium]|nr:MAG: cytochrome c oxidase assembly protein [Alphaproteobacteria bacterium]
MSEERQEEQVTRPTRPAGARPGTGKTLVVIFSVLAVGFTLAAAAVPLYNWFCAVTGYGGDTSRADKGADRVLDRTIKVRFDANTDRDLPWRFKPVQREIEVKIGETALIFYEATNLSDEPITGQASYNVAPFVVGSYFTKIACFCFTEQTLQPHETVQMPVTFYVDPEIVDDPEASLVPEITLSYTFHRLDKPETTAAAEGDRKVN